jgi:Predicted membrane protein (DUF2127)/zinc-ribbon domain
MFCHQCGATIPAEASFCSGCGTRIARPPAQTSAAEPQTGGSVPRAARPRGVTILAVLAFVTVFPTICLGIALSGMAASASAEGGVPLMRSLMRFFPVLAQGEQDMVSQASFAATVMFVIAAICAVSGYGLWTLRKWARILAIAIAALFSLHEAALIVASPGAFVWPLFALGINIWIITYLLKARVKQSFSG